MWDHEGPLSFQTELTDDGWVGAADHFDDLAVGAAIGFKALEADGDAVAVHGALGLLLGEVDVALDVGHGLVWDDEAEAIAVDTQAAMNEMGVALFLRMAPLQFAFWGWMFSGRSRHIPL